MNADEMKRTGLRAVECFNDPERREEYFDILYEDDVVLHGYTPGPLTPKAAVRAFYAGIFDAFPDAGVETDQMLVDGQHLAWRFRFGGTHQGDFMGVPATGRSFEVPGMTVLRFGDRRCVERWSVTDFLGILLAVGALPAPGLSASGTRSEDRRASPSWRQPDERQVRALANEGSATRIDHSAPSAPSTDSADPVDEAPGALRSDIPRGGHDGEGGGRGHARGGHDGVAGVHGGDHRG